MGDAGTGELPKQLCYLARHLTSNDPVWLWNISLVSLTHSTVVFQHIMQTVICLQGHFNTSLQCESSSLLGFVALSSYKSVFSQGYLLTKLLGH